MGRDATTPIPTYPPLDGEQGSFYCHIVHLTFSISGSIPLTSSADKMVKTWSSSWNLSFWYSTKLLGTWTWPDFTSSASSEIDCTFSRKLPSFSLPLLFFLLPGCLVIWRALIRRPFWLPIFCAHLVVLSVLEVLEWDLFLLFFLLPLRSLSSPELCRFLAPTDVAILNAIGTGSSRL